MQIVTGKQRGDGHIDGKQFFERQRVEVGGAGVVDVSATLAGVKAKPVANARQWVSRILMVFVSIAFVELKSVNLARKTSHIGREGPIGS